MNKKQSPTTPLYRRKAVANHYQRNKETICTAARKRYEEKKLAQQSATKK